MERHERPPNPLPHFPDGWLAVARSSELAPGDVKAIRHVGHDLVLFRTETGTAVVLDGYCVHLGSHLGHGGCVRGEQIRCPFHHWTYDARGECVAVPYAPRIPSRARLRAWPVLERNGAILVWYHHEGRTPDWEVPDLSDPKWTPEGFIDLSMRMHVQEFIENGVDLAHFPLVHGSGRSRLTLQRTEGIPFAFNLETSYEGEGIGLPGMTVNVTTDWTYYGVGVVHGISRADDFGTEVRHQFHFTPIDEDRVQLRIGVSVNTETMPGEAVDFAQQRNLEITRRNFEEDRHIWEHKAYWTRPLLAETDGPLMILRRWTLGFYPPYATLESPAFKQDPVPDVSGART